jgi:hypothetical protein
MEPIVRSQHPSSACALAEGSILNVSHSQEIHA